MGEQYDYGVIEMKNRKNKIMAGLLTAVLMTASLPCPAFGAENAAWEESGADLAVKQEYIITADSDLREISLPGYADEITFADSHMALVRADKGITEDKLSADLEGKAENLQVQPNYIYESARINDPYYSLQWGLYNSGNGLDIDFEGIWDFVRENRDAMKETVVAVIDTGIEETHSDLASVMWNNTGEIAGNGRDDDRNGFVDDIHGYDFVNETGFNGTAAGSQYDHGTHCAGIIGAVCANGTGIAGIGSSTGTMKLMNLKTLKGREGTGSTFALVRAIRYAEENGADICNLSMGAYASDMTLYNTIAASDMLFVCAAGNDRLNLAEHPIYPGCYDLDNIICVGNADKNGKLNSKSNYSGEFVDIAAPGTEIFSTLSGNRYGNMSGTSMAAPFVAGTAALLHSYYDNISAEEMRFLLLDGAAVRNSLGGKVAGNRFLNGYKPLAEYNHEDFHIDKSAPKLTAKVSKISGSYKQRLTVTASDDSGRKPKVRYVRGDKSLNYFRSGMGFSVSLNEEGKGTKTMAVPSVYSVYAVDDAGNDTLVKIRCRADAVSSLKLNYSAKTIRKGSSYTLKATLSKTGKYGRKLTWTSSAKSVAKVSSSGKVTGLKKGTATITVTTGNGLKKSCRITVK